MQEGSIQSTALFIVGSTALSRGDQMLRDRLESLGYEVVVKDGVNAATDDASNIYLLVHFGPDSRTKVSPCRSARRCR